MHICTTLLECSCTSTDELPPPPVRSIYSYVNMEGIMLDTRAPTGRPAATWIAEDTYRAQAKAQANARKKAARAEGSSKPPQKKSRQMPPRQDVPHTQLHSHPPPQPTKASRQADTRRLQSMWRLAAPLGIRVSRQVASHCGLHALEAMVGQAIASPRSISH